MPSILEKKALDAFYKFWERWSSKNAGMINELDSMVYEHFTGFGTNQSEQWQNKTDLFIQLKKESEQVPEPYQTNYHRVNAIAINEKSVVVCAEMSITFHIQKKVIILERTRNTLLFENIEDNLILMHWHCSTHDEGTHGEVIPGSKEPKRHEETSVFFCDFVGFTNIVATLPAKRLVQELNDIFQNFDDIMDNNELEKIQITGDGYLAICGLNENHNDHAIRSVQAGKEILRYLKERNTSSSIKWHARIGIHSGPVTAGVIGERKFSFNIFGDTVNVASRLETCGQKGRINISAYTYDLIQGAFACEYRGKIDAKGKGELDMYFVI